MKNLIGKGKYTINVTYTPLIKLSRVLLRVAHQAALSIASSRQEYWSGLPFPTPGDIPRDQTHISDVSYIGRWVLYYWVHLESRVTIWSSTLVGKSFLLPPGQSWTRPPKWPHMGDCTWVALHPTPFSQATRSPPGSAGASQVLPSHPCHLC